MTKRKRRLNTFLDVRRYLADIAARFETGEIDAKHATTLKEIVNAVTFALREEAAARKLDLLEANTQVMKELTEQLRGVKP